MTLRNLKHAATAVLVSAAFGVHCTGCRMVESVPLAAAPYSDLEARSGSFRSGCPLSVNGREYPDAVGLGSYGSLVYNLDGLADSFRASVGIEDSAADAAGARLDLIVDRKLRESIFLSRGEPPKQIALPLSGARQLELSIQYGPGSGAQPVVFADAAFLAADRAGFLERLSRWNRRIETGRDARPSPSPPLPGWKRVRIEKFRWQTFRDAYRIGNGILEFEIVPAFGGRIVGFRRANGVNILEQPRHPLPVDLRRGRNCYRQHTRFSRSEPQLYYLPGEELHLFGPYELRFGAEEGELVMLSRPSWFLFLQVEYRIRLRPGSRFLEIVTTLHNLGGFTRPCGIWSVAVLPTGTIAELEMPASSGDDNEPSQSGRCWRTADGSAVLKTGDIPFRRFGSVERKSRSRDRCIRARLNSGELFLIRGDAGEPAAEFPSHVYVTEIFTELELHSAIADLSPGGSVSMREFWELEGS